MDHPVTGPEQINVGVAGAGYTWAVRNERTVFAISYRNPAAGRATLDKSTTCSVYLAYKRNPEEEP